jgi:hypothetical protein
VPFIFDADLAIFAYDGLAARIICCPSTSAALLALADDGDGGGSIFVAFEFSGRTVVGLISGDALL